MMKFIIIASFALSHIAIGDASDAIEPRIVRGYTARQGQFPFFAFLEIHTNEGMAGCGASLLSDEWLITAAHCIAEAKNLTAHFGIANLTQLQDDSPPPGHVAIPVLKFSIHPHPAYFPFIAWNDIALIRLPRKVEFSDYIQPVKLSTTCKAPLNAESIAIGNGAISDMSSVSPELHFAILKTNSMEICRKTFPIIFWRKSVFCASNDLQKQSVCRGDSGGPLIHRSDRTLIGLSCFVRKEGCETGLPQGFTNIHSYFGWINRVTGIDVPKC